MVVWGGLDDGYRSDLNTGGQYDPATDTWTPTSTVGSPSSRLNHTAVWTGREMVVWGGYAFDNGNQFLNTGGRYDPVTDTWTPTSTVGAPSARALYTAVWTGREMVVWGGLFSDGGGYHYLDTGGRYDPATDTWAPTSTTGAPSGRWDHTAVWTGSVMVVWGGYFYDGADHYLNTGGRYDPSTDTWTATSTVGAPSERSGHTAVWTGSVMVIWGGGYINAFDTGGRYDPATDTWTPTSTAWAPSARYGHSAVWTGREMVVWGGLFYDDDEHFLDTGGRYDPATDTWMATSTLGAPSARYLHTAVWTGSEMVVWGGAAGGGVLGNGGRYILVDSEDSDGDGVCNAEDQCPATILTPTVVIGTCDSGVGNYLLPDGCNFGDLIAQCLAGASNHGGFVSCVAHLADAWKGAGPITGREGSRIARCAAQSRL